MYKEIEKIGSGGFGEVWIVQDKNGAQFARKKLTDVEEASKRRFSREVRIQSKLNHANIVKVLDHELSDDIPSYIMHLYTGSLYSRLAEVIASDNLKTSIFSKVLDAIEYAHSQGVIHRDLKPENVLLDKHDEPALSDFGLGLDLDSKSTRQTTTGNKFGSRLYGSPEQFKDAKSTTELSDIYSLGRILYELYTEELQGFHQELHRLPSSIAYIVEKCTRTNPELRFRSVSELKQAWQNHLNPPQTERTTVESVIESINTDVLSGLEAIHQIRSVLEGTDDVGIFDEIMSGIEPEKFMSLQDDNLEAFRALIKTNLQKLVVYGWPYSYMDRIADRLVIYYQVAKDLSTKTEILYSLHILGSYHRRYYVIEKTAEILKTLKDPGEIMSFSDRLDNSNISITLNSSALESYIDSANLPQSIKHRLFPPKSSG